MNIHFSQFGLFSAIKSVPGYALLIFLALNLSGCGDEGSKALGTLERDRVLLTATANEIIAQVYAKEGQRIKKGEPLLDLTDARQKAVLARAQAEQAKAEANLLKLTNGERPEDIAAAQTEVSRTQAALDESKQNFSRINKLAQDKLVSAAQLDTAKARMDEAQALYNSRVEQLNKLIRGQRKEDIAQAQASLAAAKAEVALQQQILKELKIVATRDGVLDSLPYNLGERVPQGAVLAAIQADNAPYARVYIPETARAGLHVNDQVEVHIDGYDHALTAQLRWLAQEPSFTPYYALNETDRARLMYLAEFDLLDTKQNLPTGLPLSIDLGKVKPAP